MDQLSTSAVAAALELARQHGVICSEPELLKDGANVLVFLRPAPVVARVATTTALVRHPVSDWLARDLAMARFLAAKGVPVVAPSAELPAGPHQKGGFALSFWEYVEHDRGHVASVDQAGGMLRELHAALRAGGTELELPWMGPLGEIPGWIDWLEERNLLPVEDCSMLRRSQAALVERVQAAGGGQQALHGDAHLGNLLKTPHGLLWGDFEDACFGPPSWDLACFAWTARDGVDEVLRSYGGNLSRADLAPFLAARELEAVVWYQVLITRFADRRERAGAILRSWRERFA